MGFSPVFLWSDTLIFALFIGSAVWTYSALTREYWRVAFKQVLVNRVAMVSLGVLCLYLLVGMLDTMHFKVISKENPNGGDITSVLDLVCAPLIASTEETYSAPFATHSFSMETVERDGHQVREFPRLAHAGTNLKDPSQASGDIQWRALLGLACGLAFGGAVTGLLWFVPYFAKSKNSVLWIGGFVTVVAVLLSEVIFLNMNGGYHVFGTDKTGQDVLYVSLKSVRTGLIIGILTTLIVTPFAILLGVMAGYFGGWVDDLITYVYTTLQSIPDILLIGAAMLILQTQIAQDETVVAADKRLVFLCLILGITSWVNLCRLIRSEVLKLREVEFIQAADAFGVGRIKIMLRHLIPNVMHIVLISVVLRFSGLVLSEAVLAYVGIGVDPTTPSWGNMINQARMELARDPVVWWKVLAAFSFMLGLVLPANLFGDAVRDALDPRLRTR